MVNDERAVKVVGLTLGVPPSKKSRDLLAAQPKTPAGQAIASVEKIEQQVGPSPQPKGYGELNSVFSPAQPGHRVRQDRPEGRGGQARRGVGAGPRRMISGTLRGRLRESLPAYAFLAPWLVGLTLVPMVLSLYYSFTDYSLLSPPVWEGLANYERMFSDDRFQHSLVVTFTYVPLSVPLELVFAPAVASY